jgi:hypothetical protein
MLYLKRKNQLHLHLNTMINFDDKRKDLPDGLQKSILKKQGELDEANLYSGEEWSIEPEGRFWIVTYKTMDGKKKKYFNLKMKLENLLKL